MLSFTGSVTSLSTAKVFVGTSYSSTTYSPFCTLTYTLYDSTGIIPITSSSLMSLNSATGEFDILSFTNNIF